MNPEFCREDVKSNLLRRQMSPSLLSQRHAACRMPRKRSFKSFVHLRSGVSLREFASSTSVIAMLHAAFTTYGHQETPHAV